MIIKKLLVPFINEKILQNAEHCYIATAAISEPVFDFFMSRLSPKCKVHIVTGLDIPTDPNVLSKSFRQYPGKVTFRIHTKTFFHPNLYIFDLPYRKIVAFISSGNFTMGGIRDNEELSYKIDTEKGVEELKVLFRSYFEFGQDISDKLITGYEEIYEAAKEREVVSRQEKQEFLDSVTNPFNTSAVSLHKQYFQEEDYNTFESRKASLTTQLLLFERERVQKKLLDLHEQLKPILEKFKLKSNPTKIPISSLAPIDHTEHKVKGMWLEYGNDEKNKLCFQITINQYSFSISLLLNPQRKKELDSGYFNKNEKSEENKKRFYELLKVIGDDCFIEIGGERRRMTSFKTPDQLWESILNDSLYFFLKIGKNFSPNHPDISSTKILTTLEEVFTKLNPLYVYLKDKL